MHPSAALKSETVRQFMQRFYPTMGERRADVLRQLDLTLTDIGSFAGTSRARAADLDHLADVCRSVMDVPPRLPDRAIVFVLKKLTDSFFEVRSERLKASELQRVTPTGSGAPVEICALIARTAVTA